jgi:hypothetical protein
MSIGVENCGNVWRQGEGISGAWARRARPYLSEGAGEMPAVRACSACAGDYEDPERTAWSPDDSDSEERAEGRQPPNEEFPAED